MSVADRREASASLSALSISQPKSTRSKASKDEIAENWEDEASESSDTETEAAPPTGISTGSSAPPPTPLTPTKGQASFDSPYSLADSGSSGNAPLTPMRGNFRPDVRSGGSGSGSSSRHGEDSDPKRPEKSTSTAARMIAAGLGVRPPKKTEEMKRYEKAVREKEERRIREEKDEVARAEEAKRAAWED